MSCNPFSNARTSLLCFQMILVGENKRISFWNSIMRCLFLLRRFSDEHFWARLKEKFFAFVRKRSEHLECREILRVHCPKFWTLSAGPGYETLRMELLFVEQRNRSSVHGKKSINKRPFGRDAASWHQLTRSDPSPNCALSVLICIKSRVDLKRTMCMFWSSTFRPNFLRRSSL